jgi:glycosyltransferase involved in cell wall biosynthesis
MQISVVLITYNEADRLEVVLTSVEGIADEIVIVDSHSTDDTAKIARKHTESFFCREWTNYADQKNFANSKASFPWILSLDADERLSQGLRQEILDLKAEDPAVSAFSMPRQAFYLGRWIRHSGWFPDRKIRLFRKDKARWEGAYVHEGLEVEGPVRKLQGILQHFTYRDLSDQVRRIDTYSGLGAQKLYAEQKRCRWHHLAVLPFFGFLRTYVWKAGFMDGQAGFVLAVMQGYGVFVRYAKLREIWKQGERIEPFPH